MLGCCICLNENIKLYKTKCCKNNCLCRDCAILQEKMPCPLCRGETAIWIRRTKEERERENRKNKFQTLKVKVERIITQKYYSPSKIWFYENIIYYEGRFFLKEDIFRFTNCGLLYFLIYFTKNPILHYRGEIYQKDEDWNAYFFNVKLFILGKMR